jgi:hypothetical protein
LSNFWVLLTYDDQHFEEAKIAGQEQLVIKEEPKLKQKQKQNKQPKNKNKTEQNTW